MRITLLPILIAILLCIIAIIYLKRKSTTIWTCTTFFDFPKKDRWKAFQSCMDSLMRVHSHYELGQITHWIVVNEWSETPKQDWTSLMKTKYPHIEFIQKTREQHGQAKGLNMILERIRPYTYWFHWEETWDTPTPVFARSIDTMNANPDITQLQLTSIHGKTDWMDVGSERIRCSRNVCRIDGLHIPPKKYTKEELTKITNAGNWPLYSLRPSLNRVAFYRNVGEFSEDPTLWPYLFELDYAIRWVHEGAVKAVFHDGPVKRQLNHVSTY